VVPFERSFRGEVHEISSRVLNARLQTPQELSGLLNRALAALPRLRANGVSEPLSCLTAREAFRAATDPVSVWVDQKTMSVPGGYIPRRNCSSSTTPTPSTMADPPSPRTPSGAAFDVTAHNSRAVNGASAAESSRCGSTSQSGDVSFQRCQACQADQAILHPAQTQWSGTHDRQQGSNGLSAQDCRYKLPYVACHLGDSTSAPLTPP
jgi:hypothetical protein